VTLIPLTDSTDWPYKASVVVCTYRREKVLCETLQQLLDQQTGDYEIIIVDQTEAHEPETRQTLDEMSQRDFVTYVFQTPPGLPAARNRGVELARSELVIFCDDDVILCDDYVANYRRIFADFPEVAAVAGQVLNRGETPTDAPGTFYHNGIVAEFSMLYGANFGVRKSAWQTVGGLPASLGVHAYTEDRIMALKLLSHDFKIRYDASVSVDHLVDPTGGCRITDQTQSTAESEKSYSKLYYLLRYSDKLDRAERKSTLKDALRQGPLRREMVLRPWLWPKTWWGFWQAYRLAKRISQAEKNSTETV